MFKLEIPVFASNSVNDTHIPSFVYKYVHTGRRKADRSNECWGYQYQDDEVSEKLAYTLLLVMMTAICNFG
jgi:hypothetical protein